MIPLSFRYFRYESIIITLNNYNIFGKNAETTDFAYSFDLLTIQKFELRNPCTFSFLHYNIIIARNCNDISTVSNECGGSHQKKI